jgi:hypothetical protein
LLLLLLLCLCCLCCLCRYCKALNIVHAAAPSSVAAEETAPSTASSSGDLDLAPSAQPTQPIDSQQKHRGFQRRRSSISSSEPYILQSSGGTTNPELPPVLDFKCVKHNFTQVMDHFGGKLYGDEHAPTARRLQQDDLEDFWGSDPEPIDAKKLKNEKQKKGTFIQIYWVCDAAWPKEQNVQVGQGRDHISPLLRGFG